MELGRGNRPASGPAPRPYLQTKKEENMILPDKKVRDPLTAQPRKAIKTIPQS